jgi:hypothetical protein
VFAGYIPLRRGILEHVQKGLLNKTDFSVYCLLLLLADHHTGIWWGSAKALGAYNFARSTARNSLQRLESKGYIKRFTTPGVHANYQILINKYAITDGQHKGKLLDAKQTTSTKFLIYVSQQDGKHLGQHQGEQPAPIQEGRIENKEKRKNTAQASPSLGFDRFWNAYPRKVGKPSAQRTWRTVWKKLNLGRVPTLMQQILAGIERWKQTEQWQVETYIPHPATFLNDRRWEDDPPATEHSRESAVGRSPQPRGEIQLPVEAQKQLAERARLEHISRLEEIIKKRQYTPEIRKDCQEQLEKLKPKPPANP